MDHLAISKKLQRIPNVGPAAASDLISLGIQDVGDLVGQSPVRLYDKLQEITGTRQDPCVLDTLMAAVHFAETGERRTWWSFTSERKTILKEIRSES